MEYSKKNSSISSKVVYEKDEENRQQHNNFEASDSKLTQSQILKTKKSKSKRLRRSQNSQNFQQIVYVPKQNQQSSRDKQIISNNNDEAQSKSFLDLKQKENLDDQSDLQSERTTQSMFTDITRLNEAQIHLLGVQKQPIIMRSEEQLSQQNGDRVDTLQSEENLEESNLQKTSKEEHNFNNSEIEYSYLMDSNLINKTPDTEQIKNISNITIQTSSYQENNSLYSDLNQAIIENKNDQHLKGSNFINIIQSNAKSQEQEDDEQMEYQLCGQQTNEIKQVQIHHFKVETPQKNQEQIEQTETYEFIGEDRPQEEENQQQPEQQNQQNQQIQYRQQNNDNEVEEPQIIMNKFNNDDDDQIIVIENDYSVNLQNQQIENQIIQQHQQQQQQLQQQQKLKEEVKNQDQNKSKFQGFKSIFTNISNSIKQKKEQKQFKNTEERKNEFIKLYNKAEQFAKNNQREKAIEKLESAININHPFFYIDEKEQMQECIKMQKAALTLLMNCQFQEKQYQQSIKYASALLSLEGDNQEAQNLIVLAKQNSGSQINICEVQEKQQQIENQSQKQNQIQKSQTSLDKVIGLLQTHQEWVGTSFAIVGGYMIFNKLLASKRQQFLSTLILGSLSFGSIYLRKLKYSQK